MDNPLKVTKSLFMSRMYHWHNGDLNKVGIIKGVTASLWKVLTQLSKDSIKDLLIDKREVAIQLATEFKNFLRIESSKHVPLLPIPLSDISLKNRILLELGTRYLTYAGDIQENPALSREILKTRSKGSDSGIRGTLSKLRKDGLIETSDKGDSITIEGLMELRMILLRLNEEYQQKEGAI